MKTAKEILEGFYRDEYLYVVNKSSGKGDDPTAVLNWLSPELKVTQSPDLPWGGDWHGRQGFGDWAAMMGTKFSSLQVRDPVIYEASKDGSTGSTEGEVVVELLVRSTLALTVHGSGEEHVGPMVQMVKVNREEEVIETIQPMYWDVGGLVAKLKKAGHLPDTA